LVTWLLLVQGLPVSKAIWPSFLVRMFLNRIAILPAKGLDNPCFKQILANSQQLLGFINSMRGCQVSTLSGSAGVGRRAT
jgi:hypothetical protein